MDNYINSVRIHFLAMILCPYCEIAVYSESNLTEHVKLRHKTIILSSCHCRHEGCSKIFNNFYAYKRHVSLSHSTPISGAKSDPLKIPSNGFSDSCGATNLSGPQDAISDSNLPCTQSDFSYHKSEILNIESFEF